MQTEMQWCKKYIVFEWDRSINLLVPVIEHFISELPQYVQQPV